MAACGTNLPIRNVRFHGEFMEVSGRATEIVETTFMTHCRRRRSSLLALRYSYSINSSALSKIDVGTSRPSAFGLHIEHGLVFRSNIARSSAAISVAKA